MFDASFIEEIQETTKYPETINTNYGQMVYEPKEKAYRSITPDEFHSPQNYAISSLQGFINAINAETQHTGEGNESLVGNTGIVTLRKSGGQFIANRYQPLADIIYTYNRHYHPAFRTIMAVDSRELDHGQIFDLIQKLRPYLADERIIYSAYRDIKMTGTFQKTSALTFGEDDRLGEYHGFTYEVKGGTAEAQLPKTWTIHTPIVPGQVPQTIELDISIELKGQGDEKRLHFVPRFYGLEEVLYNLLVSESAEINEQVQNNVLIVANIEE